MGPHQCKKLGQARQPGGLSEASRTFWASYKSSPETPHLDSQGSASIAPPGFDQSMQSGRFPVGFLGCGRRGNRRVGFASRIPSRESPRRHQAGELRVHQAPHGRAAAAGAEAPRLEWICVDFASETAGWIWGLGRLRVGFAARIQDMLEKRYTSSD